MDQQKIRTYKLSLSGILLAVSLVILLVAGFIPGIELTVLAVAGIIVMIAINEVEIKGGILVYAACLLLSTLIIPNKSIVMLYGIIFGPYTIIKYIIDKYIKNKIIEYILKILTFNLLLAFGIMTFQSAFFVGIQLPNIAWYFLIAGAQVMLILYDFILQYSVRLYERLVPESIRGRR